MVSSHSDMDNAIATAAHSLGNVLKPEQRTSIFQFASGSDVFVSLPTGYGKSLCYTLLPPKAFPNFGSSTQFLIC